MKDWCHHKIIAKIYIKQCVDAESGEIIDEELFNKNYIKIKKNEYTIKYTKRGKITTRTSIGIKRYNEYSLFPTNE